MDVFSSKKKPSKPPGGGRVSIDDLMEEDFVQTVWGFPIATPDFKTKVFFAVVLVEVLTMIALSSWNLDDIEDHIAQYRDQFVFTLLVLVNSLFILYYVVHGVYRERREELFAFMLASILTAIAASLDYFQTSHNGENISQRERFIKMLVCLGFQPFNIGYGFYLVWNMNWLSYRLSGASPSVQSQFARYARFVTLLKLDFQCGITLVILASFTKVFTDVALILSIIGLAFTLLWVVAGWYMAFYEARNFLYPFIAFTFVEPAYICYKFAMFGIHWDSYSKLVSVPLFAFGIGALLLRIFLLVSLYFLVKGFGSDLASHLRIVRRVKRPLLGPTRPGSKYAHKPRVIDEEA